ADVAPTGERPQGQLGHAEDDDGGVVGQRARQQTWGRVRLQVGHRGTSLDHRIGGAEDACAQPPQRPAGQLTVDDPTAGRDHAGRVVSEGAEGTGRLLDQQVGRGALGAGHEAESLDGVHPPNSTQRRGPICRPMARSRYLSGPMTTVSADIVLPPIGGEERTLEELTSLFHLVGGAIDPYEYESSWILATAGRILTEYEEADCRVAWLVTAPEEDAVTFLGPWAERMLTLCDPNRIAVNALGITEIPALVHIGTDRSVVGKADGWDPDAWKPITDNLARVMSW